METMAVLERVSLASRTTLGVGGPARWFVKARQEAEILDALDWAAARGVSVRVLGAVYGRNCAGQNNTNVTNDLARQCQGRDYCVYRIDHRQIGDPRPGCAKDYAARYICRDGGNEHYVSANPEASGQSVVLDCRRR